MFFRELIERIEHLAAKFDGTFDALSHLRLTVGAFRQSGTPLGRSPTCD
jgi:hypothetical protein